MDPISPPPVTSPAELLKRFVSHPTTIPLELVPSEDQAVAKGALVFKKHVLDALSRQDTKEASALSISNLRKAVELALEQSAPPELVSSRPTQKLPPVPPSSPKRSDDGRDHNRGGDRHE